MTSSFRPFFFVRLAVVALALIAPGCRKVLKLTDPTSSPMKVFDEVWNVMDQRYALFSIKEVDWTKAYSTYRQSINDSTTESELFLILSNLLAELKDGHVALIGPGRTSTYDLFYTSFPTNFNHQNLLTNYLHDQYTRTGPLIYTVQDSIGYVYYESFEKSITQPQLDTVFGSFQFTKGLIIDIRGNLGGASENAEMLFQQFVKGEKLVKYEVGKSGSGHDDLSPALPLYVHNARGLTYGHPVCLLTNRSCFSASNDFVLFMSGLDNVRLVGDQTGGGGGIPQQYSLSNGWTLQYTATMTLSPDKLNVESGIQPDVKVGISNIEETQGRDPIIEKAFSLLR